MKRLRCDSKWQRLSQAQREQVLHWLFEDGLGYRDVLARARKAFRMQASISSLRRYYCHVAEERRTGDLVSAGGSVEDYRAGTAKLLAAAAFNVATESLADRDVTRLVSVMKVVLKDREQELSAKRLEFERECREGKRGKAGK